MYVFIIFISFIAFLTFILIFVCKISKKIWQKIYIIYNQIYRNMISFYYTEACKKQLLKEELVSYYNDVLAKKLSESIDNFGTYKEFVKDLLNGKVGDLLVSLKLLEDNIISFKKLKILLLAMILLVIISLILVILIYKI